MQMGRLIWALLAVVALGGAAQGRVKVIEDQRGSLKTLTSIGDALDSPDHHPVHVLYVHGIDQVGGGDSSLLRQSICTRLKLCDVTDWTNAGTEFADKGEFAPGLPPPALEYLGSPIWNTPEEWRAAAPFVVHWMVHLRGHRTPLVVDEINWWPIALSLKCRRVMIPEAYLAGPDQRLLSVCSDKSAQDPEGFGRFYPWIAPEQVEKLENIRPHSVLLNRALKDTLVDWGLADVLLATGPLGGIMRDGVRQLMAKSAAFDPTQAEAPGGDGRGKYNWNAQLSHTILDQEFVGVTHSLGSYLLFNTLSLENSGPTPAQQSAADAARNAGRKMRSGTSLNARRWSISLPTSLKCSKSRISKTRRLLPRPLINRAGLLRRRFLSIQQRISDRLSINGKKCRPTFRRACTPATPQRSKKFRWWLSAIPVT